MCTDPLLQTYSVDVPLELFPQPVKIGSLELLILCPV